MNNQSNTSKNHYRLITSGGCIRFGRVEDAKPQASLNKSEKLELSFNDNDLHPRSNAAQTDQ